MANYAVGLDFGTNSCRSVIINVDNGHELSTSVFNYPSGELGIITDKSDPNVARQNPHDYIIGLEYIIKESLREAGNAFSEFDSSQADYQDFELPLSDEPGIVAKICQYVGIEIREEDVYQFGKQEIVEDNQIQI